MRGRLVLVRDGLEKAVPRLTHSLREAALNVVTVSRAELAGIAPADAVLLRITDPNAVATCWQLHRQGYRFVIAVSTTPSSRECIWLLNAGADSYLDAWLPASELVARVRVLLRLLAWRDQQAVTAASPV